MREPNLAVGAQQRLDLAEWARAGDAGDHVGDDLGPGCASPATDLGERLGGLGGSAVQRDVERPGEVGDEGLARPRRAQQAADPAERPAAGLHQITGQARAFERRKAGGGEVGVGAGVEQVGFAQAGPRPAPRCPVAGSRWRRVARTP